MRRALSVMLLMGLATAPQALGDTTREQYVATVEPICKASAERNAKILKGVRPKVKRELYARASRQVLRAASALRGTVNSLDAVEKPAADAVTLGEWIAKLRDEAAMLQKVGKLIKAEKAFQAQKQGVRLRRLSDQANALVLQFGFQHCRLEPAKFT
jgi:hypothetical protein